ncbi:serine protease inhibitor 3/4-like [Venturia canescens]|uniref:serine protease inhibitor 3/4-like n=1 Tax=Venturia canescens TaxID=32260 RepID=UPI001C9D3D73|nr:serine protease inhibitor 3/4-like [Venturia canescens]
MCRVNKPTTRCFRTRFGRSMVFVIGIVTLYMTIFSHGDPIPKQDPSSVQDTKGMLMKQYSQDFFFNFERNFSSHYFQELNENPLNSLVNSPLSTFIPMSMLSYGARGETRKDYLNAIGLRENEIPIARKGFQNFFEQMTKYNVDITTKMFVQEEFPLDPTFQDLSQTAFKSEIEDVEADEGFIDTDIISDWITKHTNGTILNHFRSMEIGCDTAISLANTIYHNGAWKVGFDKSRTKLHDFYAFGDSPVRVPTMNTIGLFPHGRIDEIGAKFIELPFKSDSKDQEMSMFIIMAEELDKWKEMILKLKNMDLKKLLNSVEEELDVYLPKFTLKNTHYLDHPFQSMARKRIVNVTDISGIMKLPDSAIISYALSKSMVNVDETGHRAAQLSMIAYSTRNCNICDIYTNQLHSCRTVAAARESECNTKEFTSSKRSTRAVLPEFRINGPFVAIIMTKGNVFTDIFSVNFSGSTLYFS